ncbi:peptidase [Thalassobacillus devorans]|uniref:Peptidase n=1 Tax=Thalassobacillus devorans TaxID=279813 RepID=A0ABQ1P2X1_9BACI|nr:P1 family peptidase [Thalassobacillus devorans]NIK28175.1 L-aminopeptidase/D-esterase-like protein [Thalassobacillus devorans]GGC88304.1 peptidase [Thalassobacillus devorans]
MKEIDIFSLKGFRIGHADDKTAATGCSVVLCERGAVGGVDVRGGAPGTRETDLLRPENLVESVHAVFLAGGSAYGLAAGSGVMAFLEEKDIGFDTGVGKVPIVPGAILFDLHVGDHSSRPDLQMGYEACKHAYQTQGIREGNAGAGTGASIGKILGSDHAMKSGLGSYALQAADVQIGAMVAVNSFGDIVSPQDGKLMAGVYDKECLTLLSTENILLEQIMSGKADRFSGNTSIGVIMTNAKLSKSQANKIAAIAHDGFARTMRPSHTLVDGDTIFVLSTGEVEADLNTIGMLAAKVVERAVIRGVTKAETAYGMMGHQEFWLRRKKQHE